MDIKFDKLIASDWEERSLSDISDDVKKILREFRKHFKALSEKSGETVFGGSFFLIERECKKLIRIKNCGNVHFIGKTPVLSTIFLLSDENGISYDSLERIISRVQEEKYLSNSDLEEMTPAFSFAVLREIFFCCEIR